jgi:hypothetical protein
MMNPDEHVEIEGVRLRLLFIISPDRLQEKPQDLVAFSRTPGTPGLLASQKKAGACYTNNNHIPEYL